MYLAGIDGGGSKTFAIITNEHGVVMGSGLSGCGNHQMIGASAALANMRKALVQAMHQAEICEEELAFVQFGLAGADRPFDLELLQPEISRQFQVSQWDIVCDTMEGLRIGSPDYTGVVLVCGSNTNAAGRNREGTVVQVGGFDELFGDRAGGYYLARQAFGRTIRSWDGREPYSELVRMVPEGLGFTGMEAMIQRCLDDDISEAPLELVMIVHEAARKGDWLSCQLLTEMGRELGKSAAAVIRKLGGFKGETVPVVLTGSILQNGRSPLLLDALKEEAGTVHADCSFIIPALAPVFGAVLLAMDRLGLPVTDKVIANYEQFGGDQHEN
ncbi:N-acetylglucosamine kinase [Paenibacillus sp. GCM10027626]|uniref:N-acetylglucosamine kinase n=1 Tax=Paenibacillus sp. GCM10027626 TaxID=3273411 RepID=UPI00363FA7B3